MAGRWAGGGPESGAWEVKYGRRRPPFLIKAKRGLERGEKDNGEKETVMKKLIWIVLIGVGAYFLYTRLELPDGTVGKEEAQSTANKVVAYWLQSLQEGRIDEMKAVSGPEAQGSCEAVQTELRRIENIEGTRFSSHSVMGMGGGGAAKAILAGKGVRLMSLTITTAQDGDKFIVSRVDID
jgi:hypothetical protein